jgi:DNA polymerase
MASSIYNKKSEDVNKIERQLGKTAILGLGYQMGSEKFYKTCQMQNIEISEELSNVAVKTYRREHQPVVTLWSNIQRAALAATKRPTVKFSISRTSWCVRDNFLWCELPSGRRLAYYKPEIKSVPNAWGERSPTLYHHAVNPLTKKWEQVGTYGGRLTENVVQAVARDLLAEAMLRIADAGYEIILTAHDEIVAESSGGGVEHFNELMAQVPLWAEGCPIKAEGFKARRYRK